MDDLQYLMILIEIIVPFFCFGYLISITFGYVAVSAKKMIWNARRTA